MTLPTVVLFDLDDTLFAHQRAVRLGVTAHRRASGAPLADADDDAELARWHALEEHHYGRYLAGELAYLEQRRHRARDFVEPYGLDLSADHMADQWFGDYMVQYQLAWTLHDDALPCLDELQSQGTRIGIITNGDLKFQMAKIDRMGLTPRIEHVIASGELGFAKPDRRIFEHTCSVFGVRPSEAAYVGDRLETDAIGATTAGLAGVWLARGIPTSPELESARESGVAVIRTLAEVAAVLAAP